MRTFGLWHFSFTVSDLDAAVAFYRDLLGFEVIRRATLDSEYIRGLVGYPDAVLDVAQLVAPGHRPGLADHDLELVAYLSPSGSRSEVEIRNPGESHLAIAVADADAAYAELSAAGVEFVSPPNAITTGANAGGRACYFRGPDQIMHELVQLPQARAEALGLLVDPD